MSASSLRNANGTISKKVFAPNSRRKAELDLELQLEKSQEDPPADPEPPEPSFLN